MIGLDEIIRQMGNTLVNFGNRLKKLEARQYKSIVILGTYSQIPAAGSVGRVFYATDRRRTYHDNGVIWEDIGDGIVIVDTLANRPAACCVGRLFFATDLRKTYVDTGTTWEDISDGGLLVNSVARLTVAGVWYLYDMTDAGIVEAFGDQLTGEVIMLPPFQFNANLTMVAGGALVGLGTFKSIIYGKFTPGDDCTIDKVTLINQDLIASDITTLEVTDANVLITDSVVISLNQGSGNSFSLKLSGSGRVASRNTYFRARAEGAGIARCVTGTPTETSTFHYCTFANVTSLASAPDSNWEITGMAIDDIIVYAIATHEGYTLPPMTFGVGDRSPIDHTHPALPDTEGLEGEHIHALARWNAGGSDTFDLPDFAEYLEMVYDNGSAVDQSIVSLSNNRSQIIFDSSPTVGNVIQAEYVIERL